jgi:hypothetical protein
LVFSQIFGFAIQAYCRTRRDYAVNKNHRDALIRHRLERSKETFEEALIMKRALHWNTCANRLYYTVSIPYQHCWKNMDLHPANIAVLNHF